jgi:hypothetical protein
MACAIIRFIVCGGRSCGHVPKADADAWETSHFRVHRTHDGGEPNRIDVDKSQASRVHNRAHTHFISHSQRSIFVAEGVRR